MLRHLAIKDLLIIEELDLAFEPGLNVLTGETGAGKSILLDALGFVLGWRGRADLVRDGAEEGRVEAVFDIAPAHPVRAILDDYGITAEDELILSRTVTPAGRKTARINGTRATAEQLQSLSDALVELHGQQDDRGLLDPRGHRAILDDFAQSQPLLTAVRENWTIWRKAIREMEDLSSRRDETRKVAGRLKEQIERLEKLAPRAGEGERLAEEEAFMRAASRLHGPVTSILTLLEAELPDRRTFPSRLASDLRKLELAAEDSQGRLAPAVEALSRALDSLDEAGHELRAMAESLNFDEVAYSRVVRRLENLKKAASDHEVSIDELPDLLSTKKQQLADIDDPERGLSRAQAAVTDAQSDYQSAAAALSAHRRIAADRLAAAMAGELAPLKMERATFSVAVTPADPGPEGADTVTFEAATNPGAPAGPLNRIASGGELSRFLLALKVCLTRDATGLTLIFDEIDRGVGGATADAVGRRLAALSRGAQVLVVTHSPQVAARGQHHWRVEKAVAAGRTTSRVVPLDDSGRVDEIARMLAGDSVTPAARAAAEALLSAG